ncbi:NADP-dependent oxidoreductase [Streptosporangium becharense]|nr:NADP-dependent oxidoreductase [Streptosporangium becharense]
MVNTQVRLAARPVGLPGDGDWTVTEERLPALETGQVLVRTLYVSIDPAMRGWMRGTPSYLPPLGLGDVMRAWTIGMVEDSRNTLFAEGEIVTGMLGVQRYAVTDGRGVTKIDPAEGPVSAHLGVLGVPGLSAYIGMLDIGRPREGETVVVSAAAGAVGNVAGQLARIHGCRVIGVVGGQEKCRHVVEDLGFDAAVDRRTEDVAEALRRHAPQGVDVYFDNVGGEVLDAAVRSLARGGRVVLCGAVSQYNSENGVGGLPGYISLLINRARMEGFLVFDHADRYPEARARLREWVKEGSLKVVEDVVPGRVVDFPRLLLRQFDGGNTGKLLLRVED